MGTQAIAILTHSILLVAAVTDYQPITASGKVYDGSGDPLAGFTRRSARIGEMVDAVGLGTCTAIAGAPIKRGQRLTVASGKVAPGTNDRMLIALEDATADQPVELHIS